MLRFRRCLLWGALLQGLAFGSLARLDAQDLATSTSLRLVPKDADVYGASYRMSAQWEAIANGPLIKKFIALPVVQENLDVFYAQWRNREGELAQARMILENPNTQDAIAFLQALFSEEVFFFANKNYSSALAQITKVSEEIQLLAASSGDASEERLDAIFESATSAIKELKIPVVVLGAKCDDEEIAITKIDQLEAVLTFGLQVNPDLAKFARAIKRVDDSRGSRITIQVNGKMIPWDSIPTSDGFTEEHIDKLKDALADRTIALTIGMLDKYFIVATSATAADILELGKGESLAMHPDLQPAMAAEDKNLISIGYFSDALAKANYEINYKSFLSRNLRNFRAQIESAEEFGEEATELLDELKADFEKLDGQIAAVIPPLKGVTSYAYLTSKGWETWSRARTENVFLDGSKPLATLHHLSGSPVLAVVTRMQHRPQIYQLVKDVAVTARKYLHRAVELELVEGSEKEQLEEAKSMVDALWPTIEKISNAWETQIQPALEGEHGLVINSGNLTSKQWHKEMPASEDPLPILEMAWVSKSLDNEQLKRGIDSLFTYMDEIVKIVREKNPGEIPEGYTVPRPQEIASSKGEKYGYPIPAELGVPADLLPQAAFVPNYMILSYSTKQVDALSQETPLAVGTNVIKASDSLANASYIHFGRLLKSFQPWIKYGLVQSQEDRDANLINTDNPSLQDYAITPNDLLSVWEVLESLGDVSSTTKVESAGETITHSVYTQSLP